MSLGGHGKAGDLKCNTVVCPEYDNMVIMNDGQSYQTGCGFDPLDTGCCYKFERSSPLYKCFKCDAGYVEIDDHVLTCPADRVKEWRYDNAKEVPTLFRHGKDKKIKICGLQHNPDYYTSIEPNARVGMSSRNYESNFTSDRFLCKRIFWEQGDFVDYANLENEIGIGADFGLSKGRHTRVNYNNYQRDQNNPYIWEIGDAIPGEGIFACYNGGSCIAPDICTCRDGFTGFDCSTPLCRHEQIDGKVVGCLNGGTCQNKDTCLCPQIESVLWMKHRSADRAVTGWTGSDCSTPICVQGFYDPKCEESFARGREGCYRCPNGGFCISPDLCRCKEGWTGFDCKTPICKIVATPLIKKQLMTVDEEKVRLFEKDPCEMKGFSNEPMFQNNEGKERI